MFRRVVLHDEVWLVTVNLFGSIQVHNKLHGRICKVYSGERRHLDDALTELRRGGAVIEPGSLVVEEVLRRFAEAVYLRGDSVWRDFFVHASARQIAEAALSRSAPDSATDADAEAPGPWPAHASA